MSRSNKTKSIKLQKQQILKILFIYLFLSFLYIKRLDIKTSLISVKGYKNAKVSHLIIKETDELWVSMKDVGDGLDVKSISDLVLKEIHDICERKELTKEEIKCYKMTEREIFKKFDKLSEDKLIQRLIKMFLLKILS